MKATIHTEVRCGECGSVMQYHEGNKVRCVHNLKCSQRNVEYHAPSVELQPIKQEKSRGRQKSKD